MLIGLFQVCAKQNKMLKCFDNTHVKTYVSDSFFLNWTCLFFFIIIIYSEHLQLNIYIWCELLTDSQYDWNTVDTP